MAYRTFDLLNERKALITTEGKAFWVWPREDRVILVFDPTAIDLGKVTGIEIQFLCQLFSCHGPECLFNSVHRASRFRYGGRHAAGKKGCNAEGERCDTIACHESSGTYISN